jgi:hypothetical protein
MTTPPVIIRSPGYFARLHWRLRGRLPMWVVYRPVTIEYPGYWVARMHVSLPEPRPTRFVITHDTLDELRESLPPFLSFLGRDPNDMPEIEEVWV